MHLSAQYFRTLCYASNPLGFLLHYSLTISDRVLRFKDITVLRSVRRKIVLKTNGNITVSGGRADDSRHVCIGNCPAFPDPCDLQGFSHLSAISSIAIALTATA